MNSLLFRLLVTTIVTVFVGHQGLLFWRAAVENGLIYSVGAGAVLIMIWPLLIVIIAVSVLIWVWKA